MYKDVIVIKMSFNNCNLIFCYLTYKTWHGNNNKKNTHLYIVNSLFRPTENNII